MDSKFLQGIFVILLGLTTSLQSAHASMSMEAPICNLKGMVLNEEKRIEPGRGMSEGQSFEYHDIEIQVLSLGYEHKEGEAAFAGKKIPFSCDMHEDMSEVYQKQSSQTIFETLSNFLKTNKSLKGQCISAKTNYFGDGNFQAGNWIYDIEVLDRTVCEGS